jgi:shikimate kinase
VDDSDNVVLVGLRGSGKSTLGRSLARSLGRPFVDLDDALAERSDCDVDTLLVRDGEAAFREAERGVVAWAAALRGHVIATGGGAILHRVEAEALASTGLVIHLDLPLELLCRRATERPRPALTDLPPDEELARLAGDRRPLYAALAHITVRSDDPLPILNEIHRWSAKPRE